MKKIKAFLNSCPNWQLRAVLAAVSVAVGVLTAFVYAPYVSSVIFFGSCAIVMGPEWRDALRGGFILPNIEEIKAAAQATAEFTHKPRTNVQKRRDAKIAKRNKRK